MIVGRDIPKVIEEWHEPSHDFGGKTAWRLHNAFTEVAKDVFDRNPLTASQRTIGLNSMFADAFARDLPRIDAVTVVN